MTGTPILNNYIQYVINKLFKFVIINNHRVVDMCIQIRLLYQFKVIISRKLSQLFVMEVMLVENVDQLMYRNSSTHTLHLSLFSICKQLEPYFINVNDKIGFDSVLLQCIND